MLGVGHSFPAFNLKEVVSNDPKTALRTLNSNDDKGRWSSFGRRTSGSSNRLSLADESSARPAQVSGPAT
jgi:hypothetical protein